MASADAPQPKQGREGAHEIFPSLGGSTLDIPSGSPPIELDLFVQSGYSVEQSNGSGKIVAKLEAHIHTLPENLKRWFEETVGSRGGKGGGGKEGESEEYPVTQTVRTSMVSRGLSRGDFRADLHKRLSIRFSLIIYPPPHHTQGNLRDETAT